MNPPDELPPVSSGLDLYDAKEEEIRVLVPGLLCDGLNALIGQPKGGKSWLCLQIAIAVAGGPPVSGLEFPEHGDVLYLALEEPKGRTSGRLRKLAVRGDWLSRIHVVYDLLPLQAGGADQLTALMQKFQPRLVVIDSLTALVKASGSKGMDVFRAQYAEADAIRRILLPSSACCILIHHARKGLSRDAIESAAATGGFTAAVDSALIFLRKPEGISSIQVIARDLPDTKFALSFNNPRHGWAVLPPPTEIFSSPERRQILSLLKDGAALSPSEIVAATGKPPGAVRKLLNRLVQSAIITKENGKYSAA